MSARDTEAQALAKPALSALHHLQLLSAQKTACLRRAAREAFAQELELVRQCYGCYLTGYVVMPEHVHLLISEPERVNSR